jgi:hypothetical protein
VAAGVRSVEVKQDSPRPPPEASSFDKFGKIDKFGKFVKHFVTTHDLFDKS